MDRRFPKRISADARPPNNRSSKRALIGALLCCLTALHIANGPDAVADPKPGSTGRTIGPALPPLPVGAGAARPASSARSAARPAQRRRSARPAAPRSAPRAARLPGLGPGSRGDQVLAVQQRLALLKYDISPDGQFGDQTTHALLAFQKVNGLGRTGRITESVVQALATAGEAPAMIPDGGATRVEVDLKRQVLQLYLDGSLFRVLPISSGSGEDFCVLDPETRKTTCDKAITPGGTFRIRSRIIGWRESKLGLLYNPLYFNGGIAIHGAPSVPARPASHGCVRIPMSSAEWFHTVVPDKTPVYVFGGEKAPVPLGAKAPTDLRPNATAPSTTVPPTSPGALGTTTTPGTPTTPGSATTSGTPTTPGTPGTPTTQTAGATTIASVLPGPTTSGPPVVPTTAASGVTTVPGSAPVTSAGPTTTAPPAPPTTAPPVPTSPPAVIPTIAPTTGPTSPSTTAPPTTVAPTTTASGGAGH